MSAPVPAQTGTRTDELDYPDQGTVLNPPPSEPPSGWQPERWPLAGMIIKVLHSSANTGFTDRCRLVDRTTGKYPDFNQLKRKFIPLDYLLTRLYDREGEGDSTFALNCQAVFQLSSYWQREYWTADEVYWLIIQAPLPEEAEAVTEFYRSWKPGNKDTVDIRRKSLKSMLWNWPEEVDRARKWSRDEQPHEGAGKISSIYKRKHKEGKRRKVS